MAQQLECQLAFIKELQQQMAELKAANMAAKQPVQHQQEQQQQLIVQQRQQQQEQRKQQRQQQQQQHEVRRSSSATQVGLGDKMSAKRSKVILPGEMSSEEEGNTGPEENGVTSGLLKEIADLKNERAAMAHQLECQQLLIKQLQQQLASLEETQQQHQQPQQHELQQQQNLEHHEAIEMDSVGSSAAYPEVIIDEGDPFNFVRRRKQNKVKVKVSAKVVNAPNQSTPSQVPQPTILGKEYVGPELPMLYDDNDFEKQQQTKASNLDEMRAKYDDVPQKKIISVLKPGS
ncbi:bromodomain-containing protein DDB_G0280777-like [Hermetia illucens]|uniref:bromodomain-containing protein DDB_G0280777-like n=1 Tax=Hermetia illucens TaxID=343691 RepID=UPI0018CC37BB|nr:bromodomain-containing protein DDB_G0280777-like [Hermetia illucens]